MTPPRARRPASFVSSPAGAAETAPGRRPHLLQRKHKTRQAILQAASAMAAEGLRPTVVEAAERAGVSRATAYRHFPSREFLVVEMELPTQALREALSQAGQGDPARRIAVMVRTVAVWIFDNQLVLREMLRVSLESETGGPGYQRPRARMDLIARELKPLQSLMSPLEHRRLSTALTLLFGIEPVVVLQDVAQVSREEAIETLVWMATGLGPVNTIEVLRRPRRSTGSP